MLVSQHGDADKAITIGFRRSGVFKDWTTMASIPARDNQGAHREGGRIAAASPTLDEAEVARFARQAADWWNPTGKFRPLHHIGPARLGFIRTAVARHFALGERGLKPFAGLTMLDIGCGGGLISEPLTRLGARVTGIEPAEDNIGAARGHATEMGLDINYRAVRAEDLVAQALNFDCVVCLEVIEHVPDPAAFVSVCANLVGPGGLLIMSTINRTLKAYALAIVGAEYILRWLPAGTHQWERFVTLPEMTRYVTSAGLDAPVFEGLVYDPLNDRWTVGRDTDVNYICAAAKV